MRYLQNVDTRGSTPKNPSLEPLPAATEERDRKLSTTKQLSLNKELGSGEEANHTTSSRRSQSLESRFECYEHNNINNALAGKSNNSLQIQTKSQMVRKLPALEIKGVSMNVKGNINNHLQKYL